LEAGKDRLSGDTMHEANTSELQELKGENASLKELVVALSLEVRDLKKNIGSPEQKERSTYITVKVKRWRSSVL
jgi:hypothetical protein